MTMMKLFVTMVSLLLVMSVVARAGGIKGSLLKQASVTRAEAENIALSQVPDGKIVHHDLKKEHQKLIWFFDVSRPHTKNITAVQVDAKSGHVLALSTHHATAQLKTNPH